VTLAATEAADGAACAGTAITLGTVAAIEAADVAAIVGTARTLGTLAATDQPDTAAFTAVDGRTGALAATEAADTTAAIGSVVWTTILAATEAADVAGLQGSVGLVGSLVIAEASDTALAGGAVRWLGVLAATEAPDLCSVAGGIIATGSLPPAQRTLRPSARRQTTGVLAAPAADTAATKRRGSGGRHWRQVRQATPHLFWRRRSAERSRRSKRAGQRRFVSRALRRCACCAVERADGAAFLVPFAPNILTRLGPDIAHFTAGVGFTIWSPRIRNKI
jgi:hypothetical protein